MKKGIEACYTDSIAGVTTATVYKAKGRLSLDDIRSVMEEFDPGFWLLVVDARGEEENQCYFDEPMGDEVKLLPLDRVVDKLNKLQEIEDG